MHSLGDTIAVLIGVMAMTGITCVICIISANTTDEDSYDQNDGKNYDSFTGFRYDDDDSFITIK